MSLLKNEGNVAVPWEKMTATVFGTGQQWDVQTSQTPLRMEACGAWTHTVILGHQVHYWGRDKAIYRDPSNP